MFELPPGAEQTRCDLVAHLDEILPGESGCASQSILVTLSLWHCNNPGVLTIENVSKKFRSGNYGVRELSLEVKSGVIGLLGPNGAGKTTLMQMIATITRPTSGRILIRGTDVTK